MSTLADLKERMAARLAAGRCQACDAEAEDGKRMCSWHLRLQREHRSEVYRTRKAAGLCTQCGAPADGGKTMCLKHAQEHRRPTKASRLRRRLKSMAAKRKRIARGPGICTKCGAPNRRGTWICVDCTETSVADDAERRAERRAVGLCRCGRRPRNGFAYCAKCRARSRRHGTNARRRRQAQGICRQCSMPATGKTYCQVHLAENRAQKKRLKYRHDALRAAGVSL